ncbi:MAG: HflK protein [Omnitrophica WOR_2 bacterium GWA2_47_8]|nr:MAG: HflK protein [Omnitrophica WOR_2 bacterium GWA2_47_8]
MPFKIPDTPEELFRQGQRKFSNFSQYLPLYILLFVVLGFALTSFYSIDPDEVGIIRRFGRYDRTTQPGLHWKLPFNIEQLDKVKVQRVYKQEFGFRTDTPGVRNQYSTQSFHDESLMLTGDLNVLDVTWIVQFKIKDPVKLLFHIRDPLQTVRDISQVVMREVVGDSSVSEALTIRRMEINDMVQKKLQEILDSYGSGIHIETVKLQDVNPPDEVKPSFNEVNEAKQEKEKVINQAWEAYNKVVPRAKGESEKVIRESEGYALKRVNEAKGDASKFSQTWEAYKIAQDVTKKRLYLETLREVLPKAGKIYIVDPQGTNIIPLLNLQGSKADEK